MHLCDFFDLVAGTSTGGLLAVLLTTPNKEGRPIMTAKDCVQFYKDHGAYIFAHQYAPFPFSLLCVSRSHPPIP